MEKIKNKRINKNISLIEILVIVLVIFIGMTGIILTQDIYNLDTMWVFSFANKIANEQIPYADFNMVITPLSSQVTALFLNIFGNTMMVSAFIGMLYGTLIFLLEYLILRKLNISKRVSTLITVLLFLLLGNCITDSYNVLAVLLVHLILFVEICKIRYEKYVELTKKEKYLFNNKISYITVYNLIVGALLGLTVLSKQNIGGVAIIAITMYYFAKCIYSNVTFKETFKQLCLKAIPCIVVVDIELIYFLVSGALYQFIDYTVLGLNNFANKVNANVITSMFGTSMILTSDIGKNILAIMSALLILIRNILLIFSFVFLIVMIVIKGMNKMQVKNKLDMNLMVLSFCFMFVGMVISIPLPNKYHLTFTAALIIFLFVINITKILPLYNWLNKNVTKFSYCIITLIPLIMGILYISIYGLIAYKSEIPKFDNMYISIGCEEEINGVVKYIEEYEKENGHRIYMITSRSAIYSNAMNINNGIFDLPQYGNLGTKDYKAIIDKLDSMNNFAVMIYKYEIDFFWQEPKEIKEYIINNYEYVEEYDMYQIYYKP